MHANIIESKTNKGEYGVEISNPKEVVVEWTPLAPYESMNYTIRDVLLTLGFDVIGTWSHRNKVSRALVRAVNAAPDKKKTEKVEPLDSPEPEASTFLE